MPHKKGHNIFDLVNRVPGRTNPNIVPGGSSANTMSMDDSQGYLQRPTNVDPGAGGSMTGPGSQSGSESWIDYNIGSGGSSLGNQGINNMNDLYDWWMAGGQDTAMGGGGPWGMGPEGGYDTFMDWFNSMNEGYGAGLPHEGGGYTPTENLNPGSATGWNSIVTGAPGGSQQGGTGDLGTGSNFAGGGMGNSMFGPGIFNPDDFTEPGTGTGIDDDMLQPDWCYDAWVASGAADSYEDFAAGMC